MNQNITQEKKWLLQEKYSVYTENELSSNNLKLFLKDLEKLKTGTPLAYLIGNMPFLNTKIDLEYKPLIPRPETEFWVYNFLKIECKGNPRHLKILDLFAGSGCIGIGILKNCQNSTVDFGEKNSQFIKQIEKNLKLNQIKSNKYQIFQTNIFSNIPIPINKSEKYDYILTNPPYISEQRKNTVQKSVLENEDYHSLFAIDDGLFFIKEIIEIGPNFLKSTGKIYIEFDPWQTKLLTKYLKNKNIKFKFQKDQYQKNRVLVIYKQ